MKNALRMLGSIVVRVFHFNPRSFSQRSFSVEFLVFSLLLLVFSFALLPLHSLAVVNQQINYQGKLTNASNVAVSDGSYIMKFRLYTAASSATTTNIWEEIRTASGDLATVTSGLFSVMLGSTTPLTSVNFNQTLYLGVEVCGTASLAGCDGEMTPRKIIGAVPVAMLSTAVSGSSTPSSFGTTTPLANTQVTIEATTTTAIPLTIRGAASQTANLFQIQNATAANLLYANSAGGLFASSTLQVTDLSTFYGGLFVNSSTSTITNLNMINSTSTNATSTALYVSSLSTLAGGLLVNNATSTITNLNMINSTSTNATSTNVYVSGSLLANTASSTITNLVMVTATSTSATSTNVYVSGNLNLASGLALNINGANTLNATTLGSAVVNSSLTGVGTISTGVWNGTAIGSQWGGTGQNFSAANGWLNVSAGTFTASTSPTVNWLIATSTTATSTFAGALGVGSTSPTYKLDVVGFINTDQYSGYKQAMNTILYASSTNSATFVGIGAGAINQSDGTGNTAVGRLALTANTTGDQNTAVGQSTLSGNVTGSDNVAIGRGALNENNGSENVSIGTDSLNNILTGSANVAVGYNALTSSLAISSSTALGYKAGSAGTGNFNTFLGFQAGLSAVGDYNTLIGAGANTRISGLTNAAAIGYNTIVGTSNSLVLGNSAVNVVIGTTSPWAKLSIQNNFGSTTPLFDIASTTSSGFATSSMFTVLANGNVGIGTTTPWAKLAINPVAGDINQFVVGSSTATSFLITPAGKVGIGTASPNEQLEITGNLRLPDTTSSVGNIKFGATTYFHKFGSANIFLGPNAGNYTLTGINNIALGSTVLVGLTTGSSNVAIGANSTETLTTGSNNTFIGAATDLSSSGLTNATAIGANATVGASNSLVLGSGVNVGIGTSSPYAKLSVVGEVVASYFTATSTTATSTFANGIKLTGGCVEVGGACLRQGDVKKESFTSNGTWTKTSDAILVIVEAVGAGGGGAGGAAGSTVAVRGGGGGGGGGSYVTKTFVASELTSTVAVTVPAGGAGGSQDGDGTAGSSALFGQYLTAPGGGGGGNTTSAGGGGGGGGGGSGAVGGSSTDGTGATGGAPLGSAAGDTNSGAGGGGGGTSASAGASGGGSQTGGAGGAGSSSNGSAATGLGGSSMRGGAGGGAGGSCAITTCTSRAGTAGGSATSTTAGGGGAGGAAGLNNGATGANGSSLGGGQGGGGGGSNSADSGGGGGAGGAVGGGGGGGGGGLPPAGDPTALGGAGGRADVAVWTIRGSGSDLAEIYATTDDGLEAGDIVSLDPSLVAGVKKSDQPYDARVVGIVSTNPGLVIGNLEDDARAVPVALVGRVPLKVSTENGPIQAGDFLTSSSIPGVAMKATKAGQIVGQALIGFAGNLESAGLTRGTTEGKILALIKIDFYPGAPLGDLLPGLIPEADGAAKGDLGKLALAQLISQKSQLEGAINLSEMTIDRVIAGLEIITPRVLAGEVATDVISAATGENVTLRLTAGGKFFIGDNDSNTATSTASSTPVISFDALGNAFFAGEVRAGSLVADNIVGFEVMAEKFSLLSGEVSTLLALGRPNGLASSSADVFDTLHEKFTAGDLTVSGKANFGGLAFFASTTSFAQGLSVEGDFNLHGVASTTELRALRVVAGEIDSPFLNSLVASTTALVASTTAFELRLNALTASTTALELHLLYSESLTPSFPDNLFEKITNWLSDAANGIVKFFAQEVHTEKLCLEDLCINKAELQSLLKDQIAIPVPTPMPAPELQPEPIPELSPPPIITTETSTPPVIDEAPIIDEIATSSATLGHSPATGEATTEQIIEPQPEVEVLLFSPDISTETTEIESQPEISVSQPEPQI